MSQSMQQVAPSAPPLTHDQATARWVLFFLISCNTSDPRRKDRAIAHMDRLTANYPAIKLGHDTDQDYWRWSLVHAPGWK